MSGHKEHSTGELMFIGAIFGLILGQIIAGSLGLKGFTIPIICAIIGAILPLLSKE